MVTRTLSGSTLDVGDETNVLDLCGTLNSSDGPQPHFITVEFPRKVAVQVKLYHIRSSIELNHHHTQKISIYLNYLSDDSYTPSTLAIRAGTGPSDLQDVRVVTLDKPDGWITFDVSSEPNEDGDGL
jgi:anaphase-promoting complex subunit 10